MSSLDYKIVECLLDLKAASCISNIYIAYINAFISKIIYSITEKP